MATRRELVERAKDGDHDAFVALADTAYDGMHRVADLILRDRDLASDAVQEAIISAWMHVRAIRDPDRFEAWLYRLTIRASYREARRRSTTVVQITARQIDIADDVDAVSNVDLRDSLERGFRRLSPEQRAVLVVHHYLQLADIEAAAALGVPVGTMKSRLNRANTALRAALDADDRLPQVAKEALA